MTWRENFRHEQPFKRNGCVPNAFAHVVTFLRGSPAASGAQYAIGLAEAARERKMLDAKNSAPHSIDSWMNLCGLRVVEKWTRWTHWDKDLYRTTAPTVTKFAREHQQGVWLIYVLGHALALINGELVGGWAPRSRMLEAYRVELAPAGHVTEPQVEDDAQAMARALDGRMVTEHLERFPVGTVVHSSTHKVGRIMEQQGSVLLVRWADGDETVEHGADLRKPAGHNPATCGHPHCQLPF